MIDPNPHDLLTIHTKGMELLLSYLPTWKHVKWFCIGVFVIGLLVSIFMPLL